ncbi:cbb3-type cytochrome oxidase subunit 3 [Marinimicrobium alkaliphilum]|uniref:cbb3-type cytochrome oxidase subunit 3 n=1 Tax=Marinimicrobium alkaliphilum TaxID=2202654 RepID=UPI000DBA7231|nr:cbb3-type cytochrome c oxidase subunit 3 [Marinimicrobium alkaliphilum]
MFDSSTLGIISTLLMVPAIIGIAWWAFAPRRKKRFDDAAQLPFADEAPRAEDDPDAQNTNGQSTASGDGEDERN